MKKSIFLFFAAILCAMSVNVQAADIKGGTVVLLKPGTNWKQSNARFAVYFYGGDGESWVSMSKVDGETDLYYAIAPSGTRKNLIYCRMNPGAAANNWDNKWNQSADLTWKNTYSLFTVSNSSWDGATTTWSAKKVASTGKLTASSTNVSENEAVTLTPALTSNTAINTIQSTTYSISPATGASMDGNTFTATAAGTYTVTATIKYRLNGYTSTSFESTVDANTIITVTSAEEPKHNVTVSWKCGETELQASQTLSVGESTANTAEAPEFKDYTFSGWELGSGVQSVDATANPISITTKSSGDYTLTANYTYIEPVIKTIYCKMEYNWWTQASAAISAFISGTYGESATSLGTLMTLAPLESNVWKIDIDVARYQKVKFIRVSPDGESDWGAHTGLVEIPTDDKNLYTITEKNTNNDKWGTDCPGTWSVYEAPAAAPTRYITGSKELVGGEGWKANEVEMTYDNALSIYSHTFSASALTTGIEYKLKVTDGTWDNHWGAINGTIEGVSNDGEGNVCFKLSTVGDVTVTFDGAKVTLSTTGAFYVPVVYDYYIAGDESMTGYNWNPSGLGIEDTDADGIYSHEFTNLAAGTYQFRITNGSWSNTWGWSHLENNDFVELSAGDNDNNIKLTLTAAKTVTVNYNKTTKKVSIDGLTPVTYTDITVQLYTEESAPQIWWWGSDGEQSKDADDTYNYDTSAPTMNAVVGEDNWYEWTIKDVATHSGVIVRFKNSSTQSADYTVYENTCFDGRDLANTRTTTCGEVPTTCLDCSGIYLKGTFNEWLPDNEFKKTSDPNVVTLSINLTKGNHEFKIHGDEWYGNTGNLTRENTEQAWTYNKDEDKTPFRVDVAGDYKFSWNISEHKLTVTYPEFPGISNQPEKIYFLPNTNWRKDNATFAAFFLDGDKGTAAKWVAFTDPDGDGMYELTNDKKYLTMIFCRMDPNGTDADNWKNMWNQSADITIPNTSYLNCWIDDLNWWNDATGTWAMPLSSGDNSAAIDAAEDQTVTALVNRSFVKDDGYYTLCVPFKIPASLVASLVGKAYQISGLIQKNTDYVEVNLAESSQINAGAPYLIEPSETKDYLLVENVTIVKTTGESIAKSISGLSVAMQGVINGAGNTDGLYWVGNGGYLYNDSASKLGLRTYFNITTSSGIAPRLRVVASENVETGIEDLFTTDTPVKVIENGQLIIIRDGVKYNVQGQKL